MLHEKKIFFRLPTKYKFLNLPEKTMTKNLFLILSAFLPFLALSQQAELPVSIEFRKAIDKGTRTLDGHPGIKYWTNSSDYNIIASFDPATAVIDGQETIVYRNNSPDTLKMLVFRLYQDVWKKGAVRDFTAPEKDLNDGTRIFELYVNGLKISQEKIKRSGTLMYVYLPEKILPRSQTEIKVSWQCQIPVHRAIRYGKYGENTFFVGYWYPEIAVYDDVFGWNTRGFTGIQEYHNDHNNFDVTIKIKAPNLVWAPGELTNYKEIFTDKIIKRIENAKKSESVVKIITKDDLNKKILRKKGEIQWHFVAKNIPEFPFATSDHYVWDASILKLKNKNVLVSAVYNPENGMFYSMVGLVKEIISLFSNFIPGVEFPYPAMTVFNGGGAMEYPMMVNLAHFEDTCSNIYVVAHEVGHTYFPFLTGVNEVQFPWMDEGLINFFPRLVSSKIDTSCHYIKTMQQKYKAVAGSSFDLPVMTPAGVLGNWQYYRNIAYNKPAIAFYELMNYIGEEKFIEALKGYTQTWKYKHAYPYDFFYYFNYALKTNLNWFWKAFFFDWSYPDLAVTDANLKKGLYVKIKNYGGMPLAFKLIIKHKDGSETIKNYKTDFWKNSNEKELIFKDEKNVRSVEIIDNQDLDVYPENNLYILSK